eukprot:249508_1
MFFVVTAPLHLHSPLSAFIAFLCSPLKGRSSVNKSCTLCHKYHSIHQIYRIFLLLDIDQRHCNGFDVGLCHMMDLLLSIMISADSMHGLSVEEQRSQTWNDPDVRHRKTVARRVSKMWQFLFAMEQSTV